MSNEPPIISYILIIALLAVVLINSNESNKDIMQTKHIENKIEGEYETYQKITNMTFTRLVENITM